MKIDGKDTLEINDETWNYLSIAYFTIKIQFATKKSPPLEKYYIKELKEQFKIEVDGEEFDEIKDYAENYYSEGIKEKINDELLNGMQIIKY
jgi:hypothetical protein